MKLFINYLSFLIVFICLSENTIAQGLRITASSCETTINETGPGAVSHNEGTNITLRANGGGTGATYYWSGPNGTGTGNSYSITPMALSDAGIYTLMAVGGHLGGGPSITYCDTQYAYDTLIVNAIVPTTTIIKSINGDIQVYPNPTNGIFSIIIPPIHTNAEVVITDIMGRVHGIKYVTNNEGTPVQFDISDFQPGLYFARINRGHDCSLVKILLR